MMYLDTIYLKLTYIFVFLLLRKKTNTNNNIVRCKYKFMLYKIYIFLNILQYSSYRCSQLNIVG